MMIRTVAYGLGDLVGMRSHNNIRAQGFDSAERNVWLEGVYSRKLCHVNNREVLLMLRLRIASQARGLKLCRPRIAMMVLIIFNQRNRSLTCRTRNTKVSSDIAHVVSLSNVSTGAVTM